MTKRKIYYLCILIGLFITLYAHERVRQSEFVLIFGVMLLMFGLYNISRGLASKKEDSNFIKTEYDEEE